MSSGQKLVSFDAVSFFTNVPLEETIKLIADELFSEKNSNQPLMKKEIFIKLLRLATQGQFLYKDILYKQIDGVTMGSPLGDQEYVGRKMMEMELPGKRRRGRPKRRFLDAVKEDMQEVGVKETDVEDRKMWRMMIRCGHP